MVASEPFDKRLLSDTLNKDVEPVAKVFRGNALLSTGGISVLYSGVFNTDPESFEPP